MKLFPFPRRATPTASFAGPRHVTESTRDEFVRDDLDGRGTYQGTRLGGGDQEADLSLEERARAYRLSWKEYRRSAAYGGAVDRYLDFLVGDGVLIRVDDPKSQAFLDQVLQRNRFHERLRSIVLGMLVGGEVPIRVTALERQAGVPTANVVLSRLSPQSISAVKVAAFDPYHLRGIRVTLDDGREVECPIAEPGVQLARIQGSAASPTERPPVQLGAVALWRCNVQGTRGAPLLLRVIDKAGALDEAIDHIARKAEYVNRFYVHVTYKKANDDSRGKNSKDLAFERKVLKWATQLEPGACLVTGEDVKVNVHAPDLKLVDMRQLFDTLLEWILGSGGIPRMWFSSGGDTNRATAAEQGTPLYRAVEAHQTALRSDIEALCRFILWMGEQAGVTGVSHAAKVDVVMSDVATRDSERDVKEVASAALAMVEAQGLGAISAEEARKIVRKVISSKPFGDQLEETADVAGGAQVPVARRPQLRLLPDAPDSAAASEEGTLADLPGGGPAAEVESVQDTALNGAQVQALQGLIQSVADGLLPAEAAVLAIVSSFPRIPVERAQAMVAAAAHFALGKAPSAAPGAPATPPSDQAGAAVPAGSQRGS